MIGIRYSSSRRRVAVHRWRSRSPEVLTRVCPGCAQGANVLAGEHGVEGVGDLAVLVPDQGREPSGVVAEVYQEVSCLLGDPGFGGVRRDVEEVDVAGGVVHHGQRVEPVQQERVDAEEVRGENAVCLGGQGLSSARLVAVRCGVCTGSFEG